MKRNDITVFIIFILIIALFLRVDFIFYILYVIIGVYALSLWYAPRSAKKIVVHRRLADHAFLGETVPVHVRLHPEVVVTVTANVARTQEEAEAHALEGHLGRAEEQRATEDSAQEEVISEVEAEEAAAAGETEGETEKSV